MVYPVSHVLESGFLMERGASAHLTGSKQFLSHYKDFFHTTVTVGNGNSLEPIRLGTLNFDGCKIILTGVLHVPVLDRNLVSLPRLTEKGLKCKMVKDSVLSLEPMEHWWLKKSGPFYTLAHFPPDPNPKMIKNPRLTGLLWTHQAFSTDGNVTGFEVVQTIVSICLYMH